MIRGDMVGMYSADKDMCFRHDAVYTIFLMRSQRIENIE
jgi:hypothetical protein